MNYAIIEDDKNTIAIIESIVHDNFSDLNLIGSALSVKDGITLLNNEPDFVFFDIHLKDGVSLEILEKLPALNFKIIFVTSHSDYAVEAFKLSAIDYILKPFAPQDIVLAVQKVIDNYKNNDYQKQLTTFFHNYNSENKKIVLSNSESVNIVCIEDILYAKSDNSYTTFFINDEREILVSKSLKYYENELKNQLFFRSHQQYLVNLKHIKKINKRDDTILLSDTSEILVAQSKKSALLSLLSS